MSEKSIAERFWSKVDKTGECWNWTKSLVRGGYGKFDVAGKNYRAHRWSWEHFFGTIPDELFVLHKCDNRKCVNPDHLFLGTHQNNMDDMATKARRASTVRGYKLTDSEIAEIRIKASSLKLKTLASQYNVSAMHIWRIINNRQRIT